jgi:hypothetical protein
MGTNEFGGLVAVNRWFVQVLLILIKLKC